MKKPRDFDLLIRFAQEQELQCRSWSISDQIKETPLDDYWGEEASKWAHVIEGLEEWFT